MKKTIIINSAKEIDCSLFDLFAGLAGENIFSAWISADNSILKREKWEFKKMFFGPEMKNFFGVLGFIFFLPVLWLGYFFLLSSRKQRENIVKIVCVANREKIIFTPLGRLLRLKVAWLEMPGKNKYRFKKFWKFISGSAELIVFTTSAAEELAAAGFKKEKIYNISLGAGLQALEQQDNLFSSLAKADKPYSFYKNFTVGAAVMPGDRRRLEILLQAVKGCVNFIPNFRLVVIGLGPENGNLNWLIKNLGLERRVWLVGEQKNLLQWFDDLDLYVVLAENPSLADLEKALAAASRGLPLVGFPSANLSEVIVEGRNGFTNEINNANALTQKIIALESDERGRKILGENGQRLVLENFDRQKQLKRLKEILEL